MWLATALMRSASMIIPLHKKKNYTRCVMRLRVIAHADAGIGFKSPAACGLPTACLDQYD